MLMMLAKFLKALNSESGPWAIAWAFGLGMIMGLTPLFSLHNVFILFLACVLRVNFTGFLLAFAVYSGLAFLLDPLFDLVGGWLLQWSVLLPVWTSMYDVPIARLLNYNHTITLGSFVVALLWLLPWVVISRWLVVNYRTRLRVWVDKLKIVQTLKGSKFFNMYQRVSGLRPSQW